MNAQCWLRENIKVDTMALQKLSIGASAESTDWKLQASGMSMSLEKFESPRKCKSFGILVYRLIISLNTIGLT